jgi:hypothetical protein
VCVRACVPARVRTWMRRNVLWLVLCNFYFIYLFIMKSYDEVQNNKKCTSTNINESKSDMHDQGDLEIQLIISLISSVVKQSGERESCFDLTCSSSRIRFRDVFTGELLCR